MCKKEYFIYDLEHEIQKFYHHLKAFKKYLIYLIEYELKSYNGQRKVYLIEDSGLELLDHINIEKNVSKVDSKDMTITLEKEIFYTNILR